jgi:bacterioferritin-associated ferredoxin
MVICHCRRVSSSVIEAAIAGGAATVADVTGRCGAGGRCGSCVTSIEALLGSPVSCSARVLERVG